jgi:transposase-like protein
MASVIWSNPGNPTREVSRRLGIERGQLRAALHRIKRAQGLGGADSVRIWDDGTVTDQQDNVLGNVHDEI